MDFVDDCDHFRFPSIRYLLTINSIFELCRMKLIFLPLKSVNSIQFVDFDDNWDHLRFRSSRDMLTINSFVELCRMKLILVPSFPLPWGVWSMRSQIRPSTSSCPSDVRQFEMTALLVNPRRHLALKEFAQVYCPPIMLPVVRGELLYTSNFFGLLSGDSKTTFLRRNGDLIQWPALRCIEELFCN